MARVDIFVLFFEYDVSLWVCTWPFYVEIHSLYTNFHESFIMNRRWILSNTFSASIETIKWFLVFLWLMHYITLTHLWMFKPSLHPGIKPTWSWCIVLLMYCDTHFYFLITMSSPPSRMLECSHHQGRDLALFIVLFLAPMLSV